MNNSFPKLTLDDMVNLMVAVDIKGIKEDVENNDYLFLDAVLRGDGVTQYSKMSEVEVRNEFFERNYTYNDLYAILNDDIGEILMPPEISAQIHSNIEASEISESIGLPAFRKTKTKAI